MVVYAISMGPKLYVRGSPVLPSHVLTVVCVQSPGPVTPANAQTDTLVKSVKSPRVPVRAKMGACAQFKGLDIHVLARMVFMATIAS